jgi:hypothetical protein
MKQAVSRHKFAIRSPSTGEPLQQVTSDSQAAETWAALKAEIMLAFSGGAGKSGQMTVFGNPIPWIRPRYTND